MLALRYAALLALVVWVGGSITLGGIAAPAAFDVLGASGADGRTTAGAVFGEILRRFHLVSYGCAALLIVSLLTRAVLGPRPRRFAFRLATAAIMLASSAWVGLVLAPQIDRARRELNVSPAALPEDDPRRAAFGRLHGMSTTLELVPVLGGLALLLFELKD
jgi:uncharacterized membrane protein